MLPKTNWKGSLFCVLGLFLLFVIIVYIAFFTWNNNKQASNSQLTTTAAKANGKLRTLLRLDGKEVFSSSALSISDGGTRGGLCSKWFM